MITYMYWAAVIGLVIAVVVVIGIKMDSLRTALVAAAVLLFIGWAAYYFYLQQIFVKRWGGVMTISVPSGQYHIATTWKDDNLWVENYDPETNKCVFSEYSKGNLLQGQVTIKNCNPIMYLVGAGAQRPGGVGAAPQNKDEQAKPAGSGTN
jgi:hypothetical protein